MCAGTAGNAHPVQTSVQTSAAPTHPKAARGSDEHEPRPLVDGKVLRKSRRDFDDEFEMLERHLREIDLDGVLAGISSIASLSVFRSARMPAAASS
jgi:hypothetical protein